VRVALVWPDGGIAAATRAPMTELWGFTHH
jgi:hypothetical protein